jgi:hypothetical protein
MPMVLRFAFLLELLSSCIFLSQLLSCFTKSFPFFFFFNSVLSSRHKICLPLFLVCWNGLPLYSLFN